MVKIKLQPCRPAVQAYHGGMAHSRIFQALGRQHPVNWPDGQCLPQKAGPCDLPLRTPCDRVHANFPWVTECRVNAKRLGYDDREVMRRCIETIDAQRKGENFAEITYIQPIFETTSCKTELQWLQDHARDRCLAAIVRSSSRIRCTRRSWRPPSAGVLSHRSDN